MATSESTLTGEKMAIFYGIYENNSVWAIDTVNKTTTQVITSGILTHNNSLAFDPTRDQLFCIGTGGIEYWASGTNTVQNVSGVSLGLTTSPDNAAFYNDALWYFEHDSNKLWKATLSYTGSGNTAVPSVSGVTSYQVLNMNHTSLFNTNTFGDISIDRGSGILYACTSRGRFYSIDLSDTVNTFSETAESLGDDRTVGLQLSFDEVNRVLYGTNYNTGDWYIVNVTNGDLIQVSGLVTTSSGLGFRDLGG